MKRDDALLRRLIRETVVSNLLNEEWGDYGGIAPWTVPGGGAVKGAKASSSFGTYGTSLADIFIKPFVDAAKVAVAEIGTVGVRLGALVKTVGETIFSVLIPRFKANYDAIDKSRDKTIAKLKEKYKDSYQAVADAYDNEDAQFFTFMRSPTSWIGYKLMAANPKAVIGVYDKLVEGNHTLALYMRDVRNRLYGVEAPGASTVGQSKPVPVAVQQSSVQGEGRLVEKDGSPKRKKTPGELVADALTDPKFVAQVQQLPIVKQMEADAQALENSSSTALERAMRPVMASETLEDLARASGAGWTPPAQYQKLSDEERRAIDSSLVSQAKASMAAYYSSRLEAEIKQLLEMGISESSPRVASLRSIIEKLTTHR